MDTPFIRQLLYDIVYPTSLSFHRALAMTDVIPQDRLDMAAIALHRVLKQSKFDHRFLGGYQLQLMGSTRGTKGVDVVVKKPMFNGFEKVKQAFVDDSEFMVFDGNRTDGIRAIHSPSRVGVDIMLQ